MKIIYFFLISFLIITPSLSQDGLKDILKEEAKQYRDKGYRLQIAGDLRGALVYYQKAVELSPSYAETYNDIGVVYEALGNTTDAVIMYKKALEINKGYMPAYTNLALFYEKQGDIKKAVKYWKKRYRYGQAGEFWREKARERLLKLGDYAQIKQEMIEEEAAMLSKELVHKKEQERLKNEEEARIHLEVALGLFNQGDFSNAMKELEVALSLKPGDEELKVQITDLYVLAKRSHTKQQVKHHMEAALIYIDQDDYVAASKKIERVLGIVSGFSQFNQP